MKACPNGYHLPSNAEFNILMATVGDEETAGKYLKAVSWKNAKGNNEDKFGFSALPGGRHKKGGGLDRSSFDDIEDKGYWWISSEKIDDNTIAYLFYINLYGVTHNLSKKDYLHSVRCIMD